MYVNWVVINFGAATDQKGHNRSLCVDNVLYLDLHVVICMWYFTMYFIYYVWITKLYKYRLNCKVDTSIHILWILNQVVKRTQEFLQFIFPTDFKKWSSKWPFWMLLKFILFLLYPTDGLIKVHVSPQGASRNSNTPYCFAL